MPHPVFLLIRPVLPLVLVFGLSLPASATTLTYVGVQNIATGTVVGGAEVGGLSGISYNPYTDRFIAITDDSRSVGASRMWSLDLAYTGTTFSSATALSEVGLKKPDGTLLPLTDGEGIAGNLGGSFYVSHEVLAAGTDATFSIPPWIFRFNGATGNKEAEVALLVKFLPRNSAGNQVPPDDATQTSGVRSNLSLECLGTTLAKKILFTANEAALKQDYSGVYDSGANQAQSSLSRIVRFSGVPGSPAATGEKVYQADQGTLFVFVRRFNTVPDILPIDDSGRMLVMERGLTQNNTNLGSYRIRIYEVDFNQAGTTDVSGTAALVGASYTRLSKTLLWESSTNMDNVEAMCFGRDARCMESISEPVCIARILSSPSRVWMAPWLARAPDLLSLNDIIPDPREGLVFCLYNNTWPTNFPMWNGEDAAFRFTITDTAIS